MPILSFLCPACDLPGAGIEGEADPGLNFVFMVVWRASFSSRPQTLLYPIVVAVIFPVDCSEENFGFHSQASRIILSLTPVLCGHVEFLDPPTIPPCQWNTQLKMFTSRLRIQKVLLTDSMSFSVFPNVSWFWQISTKSQNCILKKKTWLNCFSWELWAPNSSLCKMCRVYITTVCSFSKPSEQDGHRC